MKLKKLTFYQFILAIFTIKNMFLLPCKILKGKNITRGPVNYFFFTMAFCSTLNLSFYVFSVRLGQIFEASQLPQKYSNYHLL